MIADRPAGINAATGLADTFYQDFFGLSYKSLARCFRQRIRKIRKAAESLGYHIGWDLVGKLSSLGTRPYRILESKACVKRRP